MNTRKALQSHVSIFINANIGTVRRHKPMRKTGFLLILLLLSSFYAYGQSNNGYWKKKYLNIGFSNTTLKLDETPDLKSNYGASFTVGRTFYLHKKPIGNVLKFGIDATWFDLTYTNYDIKHITYWATEKYQYHQGEFSMHIGPSITINPVGKMLIHGYFRYAPSFSALYADDVVSGNYATFFVAGGTISYGPIGLGIENRFGDSKYKEIWSDSDEASTTKLSPQYRGSRAFITFRF